MIIGYSGTQKGMTDRQKSDIRSYLVNTIGLANIEEGHHGDCIGGDEEFHELCIELGIPVVVHPPTDPKKRAFCTGYKRILPEYPYLVRNSHIVAVVHGLIGAPRSAIEPSDLRGQGTWSTIIKARKIGKLLKIFTPNGE